MDDKTANIRMMELAAKAAGYDYRPAHGVIVLDGIPGNWNPLDNNGDALGLVAKLRLDVMWTEVDVEVTAALPPYASPERSEPSPFGICRLDNDPAAAMRRAIVVCAAKIGKRHGS